MHLDRTLYALWLLSPTWASYQIRKIAGCACAGNAGNVGIANPRRGERSKQSRRMRNSQFGVSGERPMGPRTVIIRKFKVYSWVCQWYVSWIIADTYCGQYTHYILDIIICRNCAGVLLNLTTSQIFWLNCTHTMYHVINLISEWEFQALQLFFLAVFGAVDESPA